MFNIYKERFYFILFYFLFLDLDSFTVLVELFLFLVFLVSLLFVIVTLDDLELVSNKSSELLLLLSLFDKSLIEDCFWLVCDELEFKIEIFSFLGELFVEFSSSMSKLVFVSFKKIVSLLLLVDRFELVLVLNTDLGVSFDCESELGEFWFDASFRIESGNENSVVSSFGNGLASFSFFQVTNY